MASSYVPVVVFAIVSLAIPGAMMLFSKLVRYNRPSNAVSKLNFESAEHTVGQGVGIMHEYFHYFASFLIFEVVIAILVLWVLAEPSLPSITNLYLFGLVGFAAALEYVLLAFAVRGVPRHG